MELTHLYKASRKKDICKPCRPDKTPQNAASDQGLTVSVKYGSIYKTW